jgi:hypothetical protein
MAAKSQTARKSTVGKTATPDKVGGQIKELKATVKAQQKLLQGLEKRLAKLEKSAPSKGKVGRKPSAPKGRPVRTRKTKTATN